MLKEFPEKNLDITMVSGYIDFPQTPKFFYLKLSMNYEARRLFFQQGISEKIIKTNM